MSQTPRVMVCVTGQLSCERYIRHGRSLCDELDAELTVVHIAVSGNSFMGNPQEGEVLEYLFQESKKHGAEMTVRRAADVVAGLARQAQLDAITHIVVGEVRSRRDLVGELRERLPGVEFLVIPEESR